MISKSNNESSLKGFIKITLPTKISKAFYYFALFISVLVIIFASIVLIDLITGIVDISRVKSEQLGEAGTRLALLAFSILFILAGIIIAIISVKHILGKPVKLESLTSTKKFDIGKYFIIGIIVIVIASAIEFNLRRLDGYIPSLLYPLIRIGASLFFIIFSLWAIRLYETGKILEIPWYKFRPHYELTKILTKSQLRPFNLLLNLPWMLLGILIGISAFVYDFFNSPILFLILSIISVLWSISSGYVIKYRRMLSLSRNELIQLWFTLILEVFFCILFSLIFLTSYGWISL
ncbi:MAG: hypothetical protein RQ922_05045 [Thermoproteota archaeon]|nr:hypothetical protein [Thermoproteota archaeon]